MSWYDHDAMMSAIVCIPKAARESALTGPHIESIQSIILFAHEIRMSKSLFRQGNSANEMPDACISTHHFLLSLA
jgi:hypothetical protein